MWKKIFVGFILTIILSIVMSTNEEKAEAASYHSEAISAAENTLGTKYKWGGTSPSTGFDCSGLVKYSFGKQGKSLPRTAAAMYKEGKKVSELADYKRVTCYSLLQVKLRSLLMLPFMLEMINLSIRPLQKEFPMQKLVIVTGNLDI